MWSGNTWPTTKTGKEKKVREWAVTLWAPVPYDEKQMRYYISGEEICPETGRTHWQTYVYFYNAKTFTEVTNYFKRKSGKPHVGICRGEPKENIAYCSKDEKYIEHGEEPQQGKRTDLADIADEISKGKRVDDIALEYPMLYHHYGRTLNKLEDLAMRKKHRSKMTAGVWYFGETGAGKSHEAFQNFSPETHYVLPNDNGWWDGYTQQETVIINDFRGHIKYDELLTLVDKWPHSVKRRGREPLPFTSSKVIITSSLSPEDVYHNRHDKDDIAQLLRRFEVIQLGKPKKKKNTEVIKYLCDDNLDDIRAYELSRLNAE